MTIHTLGLRPCRGPTAASTSPGRRAFASAKAAIWRPAQYALLLAGMTLVGTLLYRPRLGLDLMWNMLIPVAPALIVVAPGLWRNICPMATFSLLPRRLGLSRQAAPSPRTAGLLSAGALLALFVIVPLRHLSLDTDGPLTALMLVFSALIAVSLGMRYEWRSGWCNGLCPIHPAEKLYGQSPAVTFANARCDDCRKCATPCPDSTRSMNPGVTRPALIDKVVGHIMIGAFAGFIWGWYRVPDYRGTVSADQIIAAYAWPVSGALVSLAIYAVLQRWVFHSNHARRTLVRLFAACAVCTYYWYRIPALTGFDPTGSGMLVDLHEWLPSLPLVSRTLTTTFFVWFLMARKDGGSWMTRPARLPKG